MFVLIKNYKLLFLIFSRQLGFINPSIIRLEYVCIVKNCKLLFLINPRLGHQIKVKPSKHIIWARSNL